MFILTDPEHNRGIMLEEYKNEYSLVSAKESNKDGKVYMDWCKPQTRSDADGNKAYAATDIPMKVKLGEIDKAIEVVDKIADRLRNIKQSAGAGTESTYESDVPF